MVSSAMEYLFLDTPELAQLGVMVVNRNSRGIKIAPGLDHKDQTLRQKQEKNNSSSEDFPTILRSAWA